MSNRQQLHQIIDALPPHQIDALITLLAPAHEISDEEFARIIAEAPEDDEEIDEETVARVLAAEAEEGPNITHEEMRRRLGL
jgi:hypothetical protein